MSTAAAWRRLAGAWGVALLAAAGAAFLVLRPHDDRLSGLDSMCYGVMAEAVAGGRPWVGEDAVWAQVPREARPGLVFGRGARLTRDWAWELAPEKGREALTRPYFPPGPAWMGAWLVRAGVGSERTVPLLGAIWWCCLLWAAWRRGGWGGALAAAGLAAATPWPAWFLRGWHTEAAGAAVVGCVWLAAAGVEAGGRRWRVGPVWAGLAGLAWGGSLCLHPTMLLLAGPAALALGLHWAWSGRWRAAGWLWGGTAAGGGLLWWITRAVAHPYGDWTRCAWWRRMATAGTIPELAVMAAVLAGLVLLGTGAALAAWHPGFRARGKRWAAAIPGWAWVAAGAAPAVALCRGSAGALAIGLAGLAVLASGRGRDRAMMLAVGWTALLFVVIQRAEAPTGIWGFRRMVPPVLAAVTVAGGAIGEAWRSWPRRRASWWAAGVLGALCLWGPARWGWVWTARNGEGSGAAVDALRRWMAEKEESAAERGAEKPWFVFGEFRTAQGALADGKHLAVALGGAGRAQPESVLAWVRELAAGGREVWWVSALPTPRMEEEAVLEGGEPIWEGCIRTITAKRFPKAWRQDREIRWTGWRWRPAGETGGGYGTQEMEVAGAVLGVRGPWGQERQGGRWTREGSGVVGPTGRGGEEIEVVVEGMWSGGPGAVAEQVVRVEGPWGGESGEMRWAVGQQWEERRVRLRIPDGWEGEGKTGIYRFRAAHPWNPGANGMLGYDGDLGIMVRRVEIRGAM